MDPMLVIELDERIFQLEELKNLPNKFLNEKTVLGIDIYKYSEYPLTEQVFIPVLFDFLYESTVLNVIKYEPFIFNLYSKNIEEFKAFFISTGDGGFQIFNNPIEALIFSIYFQMEVKRFNSGGNVINRFKNIFNIIKFIELRYSITTDVLYKYNLNYYGPAIINNARILSKDRLNRLLIDNKTVDWFIQNINSVENIMDVDKSTFLLTKYFKTYNIKLNSLIFNTKGAFKSVDVLKLDSIKAKNTDLNIFNLHIQVAMQIRIEKHEYDVFIITLGNINTKGIE